MLMDYVYGGRHHFRFRSAEREEHSGVNSTLPPSGMAIPERKGCHGPVQRGAQSNERLAEPGAKEFR